MEKKYYYGLDWLRTIACFGIVMMHMLTNNNYHLTGFVPERIILSFTNFVYLFMTISAFGMCLGYYDKVKSRSINWTKFYTKRYMKVLPFFSVLVMINIIIQREFESIIEAIPNLTLTRGFFPNDIGQIGVAWFLGLIFIFYAIFPLFCVMIDSKKSAWFFFIISLILNYVVGVYYGIERTNIIYSMPFFMAGGLVYLYKEIFIEANFAYILPLSLLAIGTYLFLIGNIYVCLFVASALLMQALSIRNGYNVVVSYISSISLEIYLSHMVVFRIIEKVHLNTIFGNGWFQYLITVSVTLFSSICFSIVINWFIRKIQMKVVKK